MIITNYPAEYFFDTAIICETEEQQLALFEIFKNSFGVYPGPVMSTSYRRYKYVYLYKNVNRIITIEGAAQKGYKTHTKEFQEFIVECCSESEEVFCAFCIDLI